MYLIRPASLLAAAALLTLPQISSLKAQTLVDATDPATIMEIARGYGSALMESDDAGDPMIVGRIDGNRYAILFYGCRDGTACTSIQLLASWVNPGHLTLADINAWNQDKWVGRAYMDEDNDPVLDFAINLEGGVSVRNLDDSFDWWKLALAEFVNDLNTGPQTD